MSKKKHLMLALFSLAIVLGGTTNHQVDAAASGQETYDIGFEPERPAHWLVW